MFCVLKVLEGGFNIIKISLYKVAGMAGGICAF